MRPTTPLAVLACAALTASTSLADPIDPVFVAVGVSSGPIVADDSAAPIADDLGRVSIYEHTVSVPGAAWMRVDFGSVDLGGAPAGTPPTIIRLTSLSDGAVQRLESVHVEQWRNMSAFFNGDAVRVEVLSDPDAEVSAITIDRVLVQPGSFQPIAASGEPDSICGDTDDRELSSDPRVARGWSAGGSANCTAWIISDCMKCVLAAGHCNFVQVHFNNPISTPGGTPVMPHPDHQYAIDASSTQEQASGLGQDWYYAGALANPNTGLRPHQAQGDAFDLATAIPPVTGQPIRVTGHGVTSAPVDPTYYRAQKTHTGPFVEVDGSRLRYAMDTSSGNSGSPVIDDTTGLAIGIHTHGGCTAGGGANGGTAITFSNLQAALNDPRGICVNPCPADMDCNGDLNIFDFLEFSNLFATGDPRADLDGDGDLTILDFLEYQNAFVMGCP